MRQCLNVASHLSYHSDPRQLRRRLLQAGLSNAWHFREHRAADRADPLDAGRVWLAPLLVIPYSMTTIDVHAGAENASATSARRPGFRRASGWAEYGTDATESKRSNLMRFLARSAQGAFKKRGRIIPCVTGRGVVGLGGPGAPRCIIETADLLDRGGQGGGRFGGDEDSAAGGQ